MLRTQMIAVVLLGVWLGLTFAMWFAATRSFRTVDRLLGSPKPEFDELLRPLGAERSRLVLRHLASEINRVYFGAYGWAQVVLGLLLLGLVLWQPRRDALSVFLAALMAVLALVLTFIIQPQIVALGRAIDFLPRQPPPAVMPRFWKLHGAFTALDGTKLLAGLLLLGRWLWKP